MIFFAVTPYNINISCLARRRWAHTHVQQMQIYPRCDHTSDESLNETVGHLLGAFAAAACAFVSYALTSALISAAMSASNGDSAACVGGGSIVE